MKVSIESNSQTQHEILGLLRLWGLCICLWPPALLNTSLIVTPGSTSSRSKQAWAIRTALASTADEAAAWECVIKSGHVTGTHMSGGGKTELLCTLREREREREGRETRKLCIQSSSIYTRQDECLVTLSKRLERASYWHCRRIWPLTHLRDLTRLADLELYHAS